MIATKDAEILRRLAARVREIAELPVMAQRQREWTALNDLHGGRPPVLVSPEGAWKEIDLILESSCSDATAKHFENRLRRLIYQHEKIGDDFVVDTTFDIPWKLTNSGFGVELKKDHSGVDGGAFKHVPPLTDLSRDLSRLRQRQIVVHRQETEELTEQAQRIFGDLLTVRNRGSYSWSVGLTSTAIELIGLEQLMLNMYDDPDGLKALMSFLSDDMKNYFHQLETMNLLTYNNGNNLIGSGNWGLTSALPSSRAPKVEPARIRDLWGFGESQETVGISPEMFGEFIWPYQQPLMEKFGLTYYGCCEPVEERFQYFGTLKNLRCVSVSPWSKPEKCAALYGRNYVLCHKPNPTPVCVNFDEHAIRRDIRHVLETLGDLNLMIILKDTHTVSNEPDRFRRWVEIVRSEIDAMP